ncbi:CAAX prenyl protease 1 homolog [Varroa destructor]|uniref:Ste24 endopeptidase n=1 Tax=Varroa destructor TaxID=109461 RepID=A0A7M7JZU6_VARDE|nr:CAAX prenyl protease 1 homolog [Varroa destructor]XP_022659602.1 CAAX prenyl protease 1 homolog [Varroa destructor]XP_022659610.1 CAAX prenyl protease 1 homolog [Varroa destructor]XP_022659620.1 CAAX prenyl protease 1 homolog [Varroa destructor]
MVRCARPTKKPPVTGVQGPHREVMPSIQELLTEQVSGAWAQPGLYFFTVAFLWVNYLWQTYLLVRQYKVLKGNPVLPLKLKRILDPQYYAKSRAYRLDRVLFAIVQNTLTHVYTILILNYEITPKLWNWTTGFIVARGYKGDPELIASVVFISLLLLISGLASLPWDIYATFFIQIKHGISKQSMACYLREAMKSLLIHQVTTLPMSCTLLYLVKRIGPWSFGYFWVARCLLSILRETFYMTLIAPYFQKLYPLPNNRLRSAVESLSTSIGFPLRELYVFEVSQYTTISNAHIAGVFKGKSIILFDTLLKHETVPLDESPKSKSKAQTEKKAPKANLNSRVRFSRGPKDDSCRTKTHYSRRRFPDEDVLAIVCHEIGHWKMSHIPKLFILAELDNLINHLLVGLLYQMPGIFRAFGFHKDTPALIGVVLVAGLLITPYNVLMNFLRTWYKRHCEIQADQFVHKMQQGPYMEKAVITMNMDSLSFPLYDPIYNAWHNSHPPLPQRIEILRGDYTGATGLSTCHLRGQPAYYSPGSVGPSSRPAVRAQFSKAAGKMVKSPVHSKMILKGSKVAVKTRGVVVKVIPGVTSRSPQIKLPSGKVTSPKAASESAKSGSLPTQAAQPVQQHPTSGGPSQSSEPQSGSPK